MTAPRIEPRVPEGFREVTEAQFWAWVTSLTYSVHPHPYHHHTWWKTRDYENVAWTSHGYLTCEYDKGTLPEVFAIKNESCPVS